MANDLNIRTRYGTFNGFVDENGVRTWLGIPFAQPPVDKLRWKLVRQFQSSWAAFAATGNPNNEFIPHWEKYSAGNRQTMELNSKGCVCHKDLNTQNLNALRYVYEN